MLKETGNSVKPKQGKYSHATGKCPTIAFLFNSKGVSIQGVV